MPLTQTKGETVYATHDTADDITSCGYDAFAAVGDANRGGRPSGTGTATTGPFPADQAGRILGTADKADYREMAAALRPADGKGRRRAGTPQSD